MALHHWEEPFTMTKIAAKVQTLLNRERGATAVEYGLMVALIAVVIIAAVTLLGNNLSTTFAQRHRFLSESLSPQRLPTVGSTPPCSVR